MILVTVGEIFEWLRCAGLKSEAVAPHPLTALWYGVVVGEGLNSDYLHCNSAEGNGMFTEGAGYDYLLVMVKDASDFVWLKPAQFYSGAATARTLIALRALRGGRSCGQ